MGKRGEIEEVLVDFNPETDGNAKIASLLGHYDEPYLDYCNDMPTIVAVADMLTFEERPPYVKQVARGYVCSFRHGGKNYVTKEYRKASHAFAAMIYFTLSNSVHGEISHE